VLIENADRVQRPLTQAADREDHRSSLIMQAALLSERKLHHECEDDKTEQPSDEDEPPRARPEDDFTLARLVGWMGELFGIVFLALSCQTADHSEGSAEELRGCPVWPMQRNGQEPGIAPTLESPGAWSGGKELARLCAENGYDVVVVANEPAIGGAADGLRTRSAVWQ
jgi:hypothetical protein